MVCQGLWSGDGWYCRFYMDKRYWLPCCDVAEADQYIDEWRYDAEQNHILVAPSFAERYYRLVSSGQLEEAAELRRQQLLAPPPYDLEEL